jgi:putative salt-induced outer membrane protein YdiY
MFKRVPTFAAVALLTVASVAPALAQSSSTMSNNNMMAPSSMSHDSMGNSMSHSSAGNSMAHDTMSNGMSHDSMGNSMSHDTMSNDHMSKPQ